MVMERRSVPPVSGFRGRLTMVGLTIAIGLTGCTGGAGNGGPVAPTTPAATVPGDPAAPTPDDPGMPDTRSPTPGDPVATPDEDTGMIEPALERIVDLATRDLSSRTGVPAAEITVVSAESVTWSDASLGCPQPDMRYAQVPQDGARVVLDAGGTRYRYHTGGRTTEPFLCRQPPAKRSAPKPTLEPRRPDTP
jgi:hypothetical protein